MTSTWRVCYHWRRLSFIFGYQFALDNVSTQRLSPEHVGGNMLVLAADLLQAVGFASSVRSPRRGASLFTSGDLVFARLLVYKHSLGSTLAATSGLGLLQRRCDRCILLLSAERLVRTPGLTTEVGGATTCLCSGGLCGPVLHRPRALVAVVLTPQRFL